MASVKNKGNEGVNKARKSKSVEFVICLQTAINNSRLALSEILPNNSVTALFFFHALLAVFALLGHDPRFYCRATTDPRSPPVFASQIQAQGNYVDLS